MYFQSHFCTLFFSLFFIPLRDFHFIFEFTDVYVYQWNMLANLARKSICLFHFRQVRYQNQIKSWIQYHRIDSDGKSHSHTHTNYITSEIRWSAQMKWTHDIRQSTASFFEERISSRKQNLERPISELKSIFDFNMKES